VPHVSQFWDGLGFRAAISASNKICHGHQPNKITMVA